MPEKPQRQMVDMTVIETSGVDHPAHGHEGWLVRKSAGAGSVARLTHLMKGTTMPQPTKESLLAEIEGSKLSAGEKSFLKKSVDLTEDIDAAAKLWQSLRAKSEQDDPETPSTTETPAAAAAAVPAVPAVGADIFKSLDADTQAALAKATEGNPDLAKALGAIGGVAKEALAKAAEERDARLDAEAVQKSRGEFKHVAIDHDVVAPMLRKMALVDPEGAKQVRETLEKAEGQLEAADLFKELGTVRSGGSGEGTAMAKASGIATALVAAGTVKTIEQGLAKAFADSPELYAEYEKENS
jgi:hypothetical protein